MVERCSDVNEICSSHDLEVITKSCLTHSSGINRYKKRKVDHPCLNSTQRPLPHSNILPVPIPPEKVKQSAYEESEMIVVDQCGPISDEEDDGIESETEVSQIVTRLPSILTLRLTWLV